MVLLAFATYRNIKLFEMDINFFNGFMQGDFVKQPPSFQDTSLSYHVFKLYKPY